MSEYISVKDSLPDDNVKCLCATNSYGTWCYYILTFHKSFKDERGKTYKNKFWDYDSEYGDYCFDSVEYWMLLPKLL